MAMQPELWNVHALSIEFGLAYRTTAERLRDVTPAKKEGKRVLYYLRDAAPVLLRARWQREDDALDENDTVNVELPPGAPFTANGGPVYEAFTSALVLLAERTPAQAASLAVVSGASLAVAHSLYRWMGACMPLLVDQLVSEAGITWRSDDHHHIPPEPDWAHLAEITGEEVDKRAWGRHDRRMAKRWARWAELRAEAPGA